MSLRARVAVAVIASVVVTLAATLGLMLSTFAARERAALDERLLQATAPAAGVAARVEPARLGGRAGGRLRRAAIRNGAGVVVAAPDGQELARFGLAADDPSLRAQATIEPPTSVDIQGVAYRRVVLIRAFGAEPSAVVTGYVPRLSTERRIAALRSRAVLLGLLGLLIAAVLALTTSRLALTSVQRLRTDATTVVRPGDGRLDDRGPAEVAALAHALNAMLDRLQDADDAREETLHASRRFTADAGHELRTPLATMAADLRSLLDHGELTGAERELVESLSAEHHRMHAVLAALQQLARGDSHRPDDHAPVELDEILDTARERAARHHPTCSFALRTQGASSRLHGSTVGLAIAIDNLLENAARHGGRTIELSVSAGDEHVEIVVDDDGPGIPAEERHAVLERFARGTTARGAGTGLGLALVAQQAQLHGGTLVLATSPRGGLRALIRLPVGRPDVGESRTFDTAAAAARGARPRR